MNAWGCRTAALVLAVILTVADLASKAEVFESLQSVEVDARLDHIKVIPGFLVLTPVHNPGGVWGLMKDHTSVLIAFRGLAIVVLIVLLVRTSTRNPRLLVGLALVLAGAAGNLWDSYRFGHVRDFLYFHIGENYFPAFNLADICICVGGFFLILHLTCEQHT